jgi:PKD repeat protein
MKSKKIIHIIFILLLPLTFSYAQSFQKDTLTIMVYNTLNYGFPSTSGCPSLITANKDGYLKTILRYANPDIVGLVKMDASPASFTTTAIVHNVLDSVCLGCYGHSNFTNVSGYTKENMLYFKTSKFGYIGTTTIYSGDPNISDINLHTLYYKDPNLSISHDTAFINIVLVHDKSGSTNASNRATEIGGAMTWLNAHVTSPGNYIFMGDFNVQKSTEACFQDMINSTNTNAQFYDPPNQLGNWANSPTAFANYLTEDTRMTDPGDCGATGGISTRFIHILCTQPIMQNTKAVQYIPGSFTVIGQDGNHTNKALTDSPTNTSVPAPVLNALYYMSNHLPVSIKVSITLSSVPPVANFTASATTICAGQTVTLTDNSTNAPTSWNWTMNGGIPTTASVQNPSVTYSSAGTYTVSLVSHNSAGSSTSISKAITVMALPNITASPQTICSGLSTTISATGATTYSWSTGESTSSITVNPTTTTTYTVTGTTNNCSTLTTAIITVNNAPAIPTIALAGNVLTSSASIGNQWYLNNNLINGATGQTYIATAAGSYTVMVSNTFGCSATSTATNIITTGIDAIANKASVTIFPNPSNGIVTILFPYQNEHTVIEVINGIGQQVYIEDITNCPENCIKTVDMTAFKNGIYLFRLVSNETNYMQQMLLIK